MCHIVLYTHGNNTGINFPPGLSKCEDDLLDAWLEMARKKQDLNEKESKLMLQYVHLSVSIYTRFAA